MVDYRVTGMSEAELMEEALAATGGDSTRAKAMVHLRVLAAQIIEELGDASLAAMADHNRRRAEKRLRLLDELRPAFPAAMSAASDFDEAERLLLRLREAVKKAASA